MPRLRFFLALLLLPTLAHSTTYYVSASSTNTSSCTSATSPVGNNPLRTLAAGVGCLAGGDTLTIKAGTYTDASLGKFNTADIPNGSPSTPTTIQAYPGDTVIIQPASWQAFGMVYLVSHSYITFRGLILDGSTGPQDGYIVQLKDGANNILFEDVEVRHAPCVGVAMDGGDGGTHDNRLNRVKVHDVGENQNPASLPGCYCIYIAGDGQIIENSEFYNSSSWGLHFYAASVHVMNNITIRNNYIHNTNGPNANPNGAGGLLFYSYAGGNNKIYNNIIRATNNTMAAVYIGDGGTGNNLFANNTITGNTGGGVGIRITPTAGWTLHNNILYNNTQDTITYDAGQGAIVQDHNLLGVNPVFQ